MLVRIELALRPTHWRWLMNYRLIILSNAKLSTSLKSFLAINLLHETLRLMAF
jgi:hypothetical protein